MIFTTLHDQCNEKIISKFKEKADLRDILKKVDLFSITPEGIEDLYQQAQQANSALYIVT